MSLEVTSPASGTTAPVTPAAAPSVEPTTPTVTQPGAPGDPPTREEIYKRFYESQNPQPTEAPVVPPVVVETSTSSPPANSELEQLKAQFDAVKKELEELKKPKEAPPTQKEPGVEPPKEADPAWVAALREEDFVKADKIMREIAAQEAEAIRARQDAANKFESIIRDHINAVRADARNADLLAMEDFIAPVVDQKLRAAMEAKPPSTPEEAAELYKSILNGELDKARTLVQTLRGPAQPPQPGREILASPTIPPSGVRTPPPPPTTPPTIEDYMKARRDKQALSRNLTS